MNDFGTGLIIGIFIGGFIGVALMALMAMAKDRESKLKNPNPNYKPPMGKAETEHKEPTILWAVGNICKWGGEVHEIRFFVQGKDRQTLACIFQDGAITGICVPIEELEAVEE